MFRLLYKFQTHLLLVCAFCCQCKSLSEQSKNSTSDADSISKNEKIEVQVVPLKLTTFYKEIVSNGKLYAVRKADLSFRIDEIIKSINVKNGSSVQENQIIASLQDFLLRNNLQQAKQQLERTKLELQDLLIMQGFTLKDTARVPSDILTSLRIKSGYEEALSNKEKAEYDLKNTELRSPFAGIIANLEARAQNRSSASEPFCTVIDNSEFDACFSVLETELSQVKENQKVRIIPFGLDSTEFIGHVSEINPLINDHGMVNIKARVKNTSRKLFEGMNVKVLVGNSVPSQLIIPKEALVIRQGKQVVFTYQDGLAKWNYVKTGLENSSEYTIVEGLDAGAKVIVSNNLNLGHDAEVEAEQ